MSAVAQAPIRRNRIVQRWGTPHQTVGSVNEPREREERGVLFNEKWIYRMADCDPGASRERHIYWLRYDFVAAFIVDATGGAIREDLAATLAEIGDRLFVPPAPD